MSKKLYRLYEYENKWGTLCTSLAFVCQKTYAGRTIKIKFSDMRGEFGFSKALAEEKQYLPSGLRPENRAVFSNPQFFSCSSKIRRFSMKVSKILF